MGARCSTAAGEGWVLNRAPIPKDFTSALEPHMPRLPHKPALNVLPKYGTLTPPPVPFEAASISTHTLRLLCHPAAPCGVALTLTCTVSGSHSASDGLQLRYELCADLSALRVPQSTPHGTPIGAVGGPVDGLWQHTCFEAFVRREGDAAYQEFNFSPAGQWAHYRFSAQRIRDHAAPLTPPSARQASPAQPTQHPSPQPPPAPRLQVERHPNRLVLLATLLPGVLPAPSINGRLRLALSAVVEDSVGRLSHWALHHPLDHPDFHHPAGFVHVLHVQPPACQPAIRPEPP